MSRKFEHFDEAYISICEEVLSTGFRSAPRGKNITELIGFQFQLENANNGNCLLKNRKLNYAFNVIERLQYISGINDPKVLCFYNTNMSNFVNKESSSFDGSYGPRIKPQLDYCFKLLQEDPDSRQAVITVHNQSDQRKSLDVPCTLSLQFLLRDKKLNLVATMRSNDLLWGTPYDVSAFTFIQQVLASWLKVSVGQYFHTVGSIHIYDETKDKISSLLETEQELIERPSMVPYNSYTKLETEELLGLFWESEKRIRELNSYENDLPGWWGAQLEEIKTFKQRKNEKI